MTRDAARRYWQNLWFEMADLPPDDLSSKWYIAGYLCWIREDNLSTPGNGIHGKDREAWIYGNLDAQGDFPDG